MVSPVSLMNEIVPFVLVSITSPQLFNDDNLGYFLITDVVPIMHIHKHT